MDLTSNTDKLSGNDNYNPKPAYDNVNVDENEKDRTEVFANMLPALPVSKGGSTPEDDLNDIITSLIEKKGRFQIILIVLLCLNSITVAINHTVTSFHTYVPSFYCLDERNGSECGPTINQTVCPGGYKFDEVDDRSVAVEWSLVCNRALLAPLINSLYFAGVTIGSLVCGTLADLWGRKKLTLGCLYCQALMAIGLYFSNSLELFIVFRFLQGFFIQGLQTCSYTLMLEYCPARYRTAAAVLWELNWAIGLGVLGIAAYAIRTWRTLTLVLLIPTGVSLIYFWIFPESISWLYSKRRYSGAHRVTLQMARRNKDRDIIQECEQINLIESRMVAGKQTNEKDVAGGGMLDVVRSRPLRKHLLIMISVWFSVTLSYYGILYFLPSLAGNRHVNFLIGAGVEAVAYVLAFFLLSKAGRRIPMAAYQFVNGILCILMGLISTLAPDGDFKQYSLIPLALLAKGLAVSSFCGMFIYCSELFPTICRGVALGLCGFAARCGSLLAPQLMILVIWPYIPMSIMGVAILITGTLTLLLPETLFTKLPNTIAQADDLWGSKK